MSLTREQVELYFKNQGRPDADEAWYDEFLNAGEKQHIYDEIVQNDYDLSDVDRWFHLNKVLGANLKFETAMSINSALWEEEIETMELNAPEHDSENVLSGDYSEVAEAIKDAYMKDDVELASHFSTCKAPDLTIEDTVRLYSDLKQEIDGDRIFEFKDGTGEVKALWSKDEPFFSKEEVAELFSDYAEQEDPLMAFIEQEVPYRLKNYFDYEVSDDVIAQIVAEVQENTDVMFDYDRFDAFLEKECDKIFGLERKPCLFRPVSPLEFEEAWNAYKDNAEELMDETPVAKLGFKNVEIYVALEKENREEYVTLFTCVCEDGEWRTADFFNDDVERNDKIKGALEIKDWDTLKNIMYGMLTKYCDEKNIVAEPYVSDESKIRALQGELSNLRHERNGAIEFGEDDLLEIIEKRIIELQHELDCELNAGTEKFKTGNFIDDEEKMRDFKELSKEEFLQSYSYLTEQEYENTRLFAQYVKQNMFLFDEEILINDDYTEINGYLWAVDALVDRLPSSESMENINFYADYNLQTGEIKLTASYDTVVEDGELNKVAEVSLNDKEKQELINAFEQYCRKDCGKSCLDMINEARVEDGLERLAGVEAVNDKKPGLAEQIKSAQSKAAGTVKTGDVNKLKDKDR